MLADLDDTLRQLLKEELPKPYRDIEVNFDQPNHDNTGNWSQKPTINLFLYDMRENPILRAHQWEQLHGRNGKDHQAHLKRTPFRVDCSYMLTAWANYPEDEHRLLTQCMLALFRFPILPKKYLTESLRDQPFEIPTRLASHDKLTNPAEVWSSLNNEIRPSISYVVTLALDPWAELPDPIFLVRTRTLQTGQADALSSPRSLISETRSEMVNIGGTVRGKDGSILQIVEVAIKETGQVTTTDKDGRFVLGSLLPGKFTLIATGPDGKPQEKQIRIPEKEGDYDMELE